MHERDGVEEPFHKVSRSLAPLTMQVTEEDGGRLNAFAKEPRMVVVDKAERGGANRLLLIGGLVLVLVLVAVAARIS
jgi:hypothetical protein